jgi:hypothetical protein
MSIDRIVLAALTAGDNSISEPPERYLELDVIGGVLYLGARRGPEQAERPGEIEYRIEVLADSLQRALGALITDSEVPLPENLR